MTMTSFETPVIFGSLCESRPESTAGAERRIRAQVEGAVLLPFQVRKAHLKNVVRCMQLMDVMGLIVTGSLCKPICRHIPSLHRSAMDAGKVDTVVRRGRRFVGYCAEEIARSEWAKKHVKTNIKVRPPAAGRLARRTLEISVELLTEAVPSN